MDIDTLKRLCESGDDPWPDHGPEFDTLMLKATQTGYFEDLKTGETRDIFESTKKAAELQGVTLVPLSQMRDMQGRPMQLDKRYLWRVADSTPNRMTDYEDNNLRRVVNNGKWHNGIYLKFFKQYSHKDLPLGVYYGGRDKYLDGTRVSGNDVTLSANRPTSNWMFEPKGLDKDGHHRYAVWSERWTSWGSGWGQGSSWWLDTDIVRAGYDKDWEWRVYQDNDNPPNGWFHIKFDRVDYSE